MRQRSFQNELAVDPNHAQALAYLGDIALKEDKTQEALGYLEKATRQRKDLRIAYLDLGAVLTQLKRNPEALTALQRAIALDSSQPDAHFRLGRLYQRWVRMRRRRRSLPRCSNCIRRQTTMWLRRCRSRRKRRRNRGRR